MSAVRDYPITRWWLIFCAVMFVLLTLAELIGVHL